MSAEIVTLIETLQGWPREDLDELIQVARAIQASRSGVYAMNTDERTLVGEGLDQVRRGEFVPDDEMSDLWRRLGA